VIVIEVIALLRFYFIFFCKPIPWIVADGDDFPLHCSQELLVVYGPMAEDNGQRKVSKSKLRTLIRASRPTTDVDADERLR
jgi:hypothetical protein